LAISDSDTAELLAMAAKINADVGWENPEELARARESYNWNRGKE
jgi:hypothetical protein